MQHAEERSPDYGAGDIKFETGETPNVAIGSTKSISSPSLLVQDPLPLLQMRFSLEGLRSYAHLMIFMVFSKVRELHRDPSAMHALMH